MQVHKNYAAFLAAVPNSRILACTTKGSRPHSDIVYQPNDVLLFGSETHGLAADVLDSIATDCRIRIPMLPGSRSLNLSNSVAIISYEAWRQQGFVGGE